MNRNRITLFALMLLTVFNLTVPVVYAEKPVSEMSEEEKTEKVKQEMERSKKEREKYKHQKVSEVLMELEDEYKKGADDAEKRFNAGEEIKDADGNVLTRLEDVRKKGGLEGTKKVTQNWALTIKEGGKVRVHIILKEGISPDLFDKAALHPYGGEIGKGAGNRLQADIPIDKIRKIAEEIESIEFIVIPDKPVLLNYQTEGVGITNASIYHSSGIDGKLQDGTGLKVAVIDGGFEKTIRCQVYTLDKTILL